MRWRKMFLDLMSNVLPLVLKILGDELAERGDRRDVRQGLRRTDVNFARSMTDEDRQQSM